VGEKRILVVADDPDLRALYRFVLQRHGYASLTAHGKTSSSVWPRRTFNEADGRLVSSCWNGSTDWLPIISMPGVCT